MTTSLKTYFKCETEKPLTDFYKHPMMADGHLGKCKECTKVDVRKNRRDRIDYYTNYEKHRAMQPHRVAMRYQYQQTEEGKAAVARAHEKWKQANPVKARANNQVTNAVRDGRLVKPDRCSECGKGGRIHGHHDDYRKPLVVRWLCPKCHSDWHAENGEGANAHDNPEPAVAADGARKSA